jgi:hypothetical protein
MLLTGLNENPVVTTTQKKPQKEEGKKGEIISFSAHGVSFKTKNFRSHPGRYVPEW